MPKLKTPFEMPSIDHTKQRLRLQNIIDSASTSLGDLGFPKSLAFAKVPKTMSFIGSNNLFKDKEAPLSPHATEESKASKKGGTTRKQLITSKTKRDQQLIAP